MNRIVSTKTVYAVLFSRMRSTAEPTDRWQFGTDLAHAQSFLLYQLQQGAKIAELQQREVYKTEWVSY